MTDKAALRQFYANVRVAQPRKADLDAALTQRILTSAVFVRARCIMAYAAVRGEADLTGGISAALSQGKTVCLPRCGADGGMEAVAIASLDELLSGAYGILEPPGAHAVPPRQIDLVLSPGLAFDPQGNRLGYGKGYYDRFLTRVGEETVVAGVCYEMQLAKQLPAERHDLRVGLIFTEERTIIL